MEKEILLAQRVLQEGHVPLLESSQPKGLTSKKQVAGAKKNPTSIGCGWCKGVVADGCNLGQV